jgi:TRAP-type C4-dicarboxylate transport system permease large subunit
LAGYFILGDVTDELAMLRLTVLIDFPVMMQRGFDALCFGVIIVTVVTYGMIC